MTILITGGSGFIGTVLARYLIEKGQEVVIFDKKSSSTYPDRVVLGDVRDAAALSAACRGVRTIVHLAAEHADDVSPISLYYDVNVGGTKNVIAAAESAEVDSIIFTSSVAVYGLNTGISNEESKIAPFNDYGKSKWESEEALTQWQSKNPSRNLTIIRPSVVFGEGNRGNVYNLISAIKNKRFIMIGNGSHKKSVSYVENISAFISEIIKSSRGIQIFNYADKPDITTSNLVALIRHELGMAESGVRLPLTIGLIAGNFFDLIGSITGKRFPISAIRIRKFNSDTIVSADRALNTGFRSSFTIADGLRRMIQSEFR